ncbi:MAG: class I SAM-dependent methyltransferase [Candidatus Gracilibacteria bacterium]
MSETSLTELQADLPPEMLSRSLEAVMQLFDSCPGFSFEEEIEERLDITNQRILRVLSAACGSGAHLEELCRTIDTFSDSPIAIAPKIEAMGIDLKPQPSLIPEEVLCLGPSRSLSARLISGDIQDLASIPDDWIDFYWCASGFQYTPNTLEALEEAWRVLRKPADGYPGGVMIIDCPWRLLSNPSISQILDRTPGARATFSLRQSMSPFTDRVGDQFILARKGTDTEFRGFPFRFTGAIPAFENPENARKKHCVIGQYEALER